MNCQIHEFASSVVVGELRSLPHRSTRAGAGSSFFLDSKICLISHNPGQAVTSGEWNVGSYEFHG
jgi:hypothetical protein